MGPSQLSRWGATGALLALLLSTASGCMMCCNPMYDAYPAYGGAMERTDRFHGRVGSAFEPAGMSVVPPPAEPVEAIEEVPAEAEPEPAEDEPMPDEPTPRIQPAEPVPPLETRIFSALRKD